MVDTDACPQRLTRLATSFLRRADMHCSSSSSAAFAGSPWCRRAGCAGLVLLKRLLCDIFVALCSCFVKSACSISWAARCDLASSCTTDVSPWALFREAAVLPTFARSSSSRICADRCSAVVIASSISASVSMPIASCIEDVSDNEESKEASNFGASTSL